LIGGSFGSPASRERYAPERHREHDARERVARATAGRKVERGHIVERAEVPQRQVDTLEEGAPAAHDAAGHRDGRNEQGASGEGKEAGRVPGEGEVQGDAARRQAGDDHAGERAPSTDARGGEDGFPGTVFVLARAQGRPQ
jgi:hypothetical protein